MDTSYLPSNPTQPDRQSWHKFLSELGVTDFLKVSKVEKSFDKSNIVSCVCSLTIAITMQFLI